ncbi:MAG: hypothetical protein JW878_06120 [Methanomicrobia archaeon]|nr:hypothetical protein [Methanomicrobia archaeon]
MLRIIKSNEAISPVIGMALILGIVVTAVGIIYSVEMPKIESAKEEAQLENMRSNFLTLQTDIRDLVQSPSTGRVTKMQLEAGSIGAYAAGSANGTGYIRYIAGDDIIAYENGAVFAKYAGGNDYAEVISDPIMYVDVDDDNVTHVYIHAITLNGSKSVAGTGPAEFALTQGKHTKKHDNVETNNLIFHINSTFYRGWEEYFREIFAYADLEEGPLNNSDCNVSTSDEDESVTIFIEGKEWSGDEYDITLYYVKTEVIVS